MSGDSYNNNNNNKIIIIVTIGILSTIMQSFSTITYSSSVLFFRSQFNTDAKFIVSELMGSLRQIVMAGNGFSDMDRGSFILNLFTGDLYHFKTISYERNTVNIKDPITTHPQQALIKNN